MLFPIGTERKQLRLPYATLALIVLNVVFYTITQPIAAEQDRQQLASIRELAELEQRVMLRHTRAPWQLEEKQFEAFWQRWANGEVGAGDHPDYRAWLALRSRLEQQWTQHVFYRWGYGAGPRRPLTLLSSLFLHADWLHLLGNMLFLWTVGVNMEDVWGRWIFLGLYFLGGVAANLAQAAASGSVDIPTIGASGAVAAVMGAFLIRHHRVRIRFLAFVGVPLRFAARAVLVLPLWLGFQLLGAARSDPEQGGVAFWAHIGGFGLGAVVGLMLGGVERRHLQPRLERADSRRATAEQLELAARARAQGDGELELVAIRAALDHSPEDLELRRRLLELLLRLQHRQDATETASELLRRLWQTGRRDAFAKLVSELERRRLEALLSPRDHYHQAQLLAAERPREAAMRLRQLVETQPDDPIAGNALALYADLLDRLGQPRAAAQSRGLLIERYPELARDLDLA